MDSSKDCADESIDVIDDSQFDTNFSPPDGPSNPAQATKQHNVSLDFTFNDIPIPHILQDISHNVPSPSASINEESTNTSIITIDSSNKSLHTPSEKHIPGTDLIALLKHASQGERLLDRRNKLDAHDRKDLNHILGEVLAPERKRHIPVTETQYLFWIGEIKSVFPNENPNYYYVKHSENTKSKGIKGSLQIKVHNLKSKWRSRAKYRDEPVANTDNEIGESEEEQSDVAIQTSEETRKKFEVLALVLDIGAVAKLYWEETFTARMKTQADGTINDYFAQFPLLKHPNGIELLLLDFEKLHPGKSDCFITEWPKIAQAILKIARRRRITETFRYEEAETPLAAAFLLSFIFKAGHVSKACEDLTKVRSKQGPTKAKRARKTAPENGAISEESKTLNVSREQALDTFLLHVKTVGEVYSSVENLRKRREKLRQTLQPLVVIVGKVTAPDAFYVLVNDVKYLLPDITSAIDACFKVIFALNAQYPCECRRNWLFIQKFIFDITTCYDPIYIRMADFITDIKANL